MSGVDKGKNFSFPGGPGSELSPRRDQANTSVALSLEQKYGPDLCQHSLLRAGETPDGYLARQLELYPQPAQQAYLHGLHAIMPLAIGGHIALQGFAEGQALDPQITSLYPPHLNVHLVGRGLKDESLMYLRADPARVAPVIAACNLAEFEVRSFGHQQVESVRRQVEAMVLGSPNTELPSPPTPVSGWYQPVGSISYQNIYLKGTGKRDCSQRGEKSGHPRVAKFAHQYNG